MFVHEESAGALYCHWMEAEDEQDVNEYTVVKEADPVVAVASAGSEPLSPTPGTVSVAGFVNTEAAPFVTTPLTRAPSYPVADRPKNAWSPENE
jgi:hypothetical protein